MKLCLICDDHALMREAISITVRNIWPAIEIVEAGDFPTAWGLAQGKPDLCLCDLAMPGSAPLAGINKLREIQPDMPIIVITGSATDDEMMTLLKCGVRGFVPKSSAGPVVEAAIRLVVVGGTYLPPRLAEIAQHTLPSEKAEPPTALTLQQRRVLDLLAQGLSNKEIAAKLNIAPSTVKFHVDRLLTRFDARNRAEIVRKSQSSDAHSTTNA
jgi:DNA-binding NarL/FixJ family response regulator